MLPSLLHVSFCAHERILKNRIWCQLWLTIYSVNQTKQFWVCFFFFNYQCLGVALRRLECRTGDRGAPRCRRGRPATFHPRSGSCRARKGCDRTRRGSGSRSVPSRWRRCWEGLCRKLPCPEPRPRRRTEAGWWRRRSAETPGSDCRRTPTRSPAAPRRSGLTRGCSVATRRASGGKAAPGSWGWPPGWWAHKPERCQRRCCGEIQPRRKEVRGCWSLCPDTYPLLETGHPCWWKRRW